MKLHDKLERVSAFRDIDAYLNLLHEDFTVTFHKSGNSFSKEEWASMVTGMLAYEKFIHESVTPRPPLKLTKDVKPIPLS